MKIGIFGINGKMGKLLAEEILKSEDLILLWGVDPVNETPFKNIQISSSLEEMTVPDCIIDFSYHKHINSILEYALKYNCPLVIATTAHTNEEKALINKASQEIAIFSSANLSYGIKVLIDIIKQITNKLTDFDIEIEEIHHRDKNDAPSGTALQIAQAINDELINKKNITNGHQQKRKVNEIGVHAIRGGSIVGSHRILFISDDEVLEIKHEACSKTAFVKGAIIAARFIINQAPGLYGMKNLTFEGMKR